MSTPRPPVTASTSPAKAVVRESKTCSIAERAEVVALGLAAGRGDDLGPGPPAQLDRGQADAARRGVDEHRLAAAHPPELAQRVVRGEQATGNAAAAPASRRRGRGATNAAGSVTCEANMLVPRYDGVMATTSSPTASAATSGPMATTVPAHSRTEGDVGARLHTGVHTHGFQHVEEVEARCFDADLHLARSGVGANSQPRADAVERHRARRPRCGTHRSSSGRWLPRGRLPDVPGAPHGRRSGRSRAGRPGRPRRPTGSPRTGRRRRRPTPPGPDRRGCTATRGARWRSTRPKPHAVA